MKNALLELLERTPLWLSSLVMCFFFWAIAGLIYADIVQSFLHIWMNDITFNHCFLILPIFCGLIYYQRTSLWGIPVQFKPIFLIGVIITSVGCYLAYQIGINLIAQFFFILLLQMIFMTIFGSAISRALWFPLLFLWFLLPFGTDFIAPYQMILAHISSFILTLSYIPHHQEGIFIYTEYINFYVAEACVGFRFLIANIVLMSLYCYFSLKEKHHIIKVMILSLLIPIIGNMVRIYMIMMIGYLSKGKYAAGADHLLYGWVFFSVLCIFNLLWAERYYRIEKANMPLNECTQKDVFLFYDSNHILFARNMMAMCVAIFSGITLGGLEKNFPSQKTQITIPNFFECTYHKEFLCHLNIAFEIVKKPDFHISNHDAEIHFKHPKYPLYMGIYHYETQRADKEAASYLNKFHNEKNWFLSGTKQIQWQGQLWNAVWVGHDKAGYRLILYHYYHGGGGISLNMLGNKTHLLEDMLFHHTSNGGIVYVKQDVPSYITNMDDAITYLLEF